MIKIMQGWTWYKRSWMRQGRLMHRRFHDTIHGKSLPPKLRNLPIYNKISIV